MMDLLGTIVLWALAVALVLAAILNWLTEEGQKSAGALEGRRSGWYIAGLVGAALIVLLLAGCATPVVTTQPSSCSSLLPQEWQQGVAGAPLPEGDTVGDWVAFGDAQTGKLDQANGRTKDAIGIVGRCEERDAKAVHRATRGFFGRLFGG